MVCNVLFKNEDQAICPAECVNAVNRDERAFVKHGLMQDLPRGGATFLWSGQVACRGSGVGVTTRLLRRFWACTPPPPKNIFKWCNLVRFGVYFHNFFT